MYRLRSEQWQLLLDNVAEVCSPGSGYGYPLERALTGWFGGGTQRPTEVRFDNFRELVASVMFNKTWKPPVDPDFQVLDEEDTELTASEQAEVLAMVGSFQARFGVEFQPGYNHQACTLDFLYKPIGPTSECGIS